MSTRLIVMPGEDALTRTRKSDSAAPRARKACRILFGRSNPDKTLQFCREQLREHQVAATARYAFDFEAGVPLGGAAASPRYVYTRCEVVPPKTPAKKRVRDADGLSEEVERAYFEPGDLADCLREARGGADAEDEVREPLKEKKQTFITDFMSQRKRNIMGEKKLDRRARVPTKKAKLNANS